MAQGHMLSADVTVGRPINVAKTFAQEIEEG